MTTWSSNLLRRSPAGNQSRPATLASSRKRVLRVGRVNARRWSGPDAPGAVKHKTAGPVRARRWSGAMRPAADRFSRALRRIAEWCRTHRHHAVKEQCPQVRTSEGAGRPGAGAVSETERALRVLRDNRELGGSGRFPIPRQTRLAEVAFTPLADGARRMGPLRAPAGRFNARRWSGADAPGSRGTLCPPRAWLTPCASRSEPASRGAGCVNRARPDLWGPGAGNRPRLPDWRGECGADNSFTAKIAETAENGQLH